MKTADQMLRRLVTSSGENGFLRPTAAQIGAELIRAVDSIASEGACSLCSQLEVDEEAKQAVLAEEHERGVLMLLAKVSGRV